MNAETPNRTPAPRSLSVTVTTGVTALGGRLAAALHGLAVGDLAAALFVVALVAYVALLAPPPVIGLVVGFTAVVALLVVAPLAVLWLVR